MNIERESSRFVAIIALVVVASVIAIHAMHIPMSSMSEWPMPGGWMSSPAFTPMCGRAWLRAMAAFIGMWLAIVKATRFVFDPRTFNATCDAPAHARPARTRCR